MVSKRNKKLMLEKQAAKKQRYGLRKLSVGVASVLLGMTFLGAGSISAAENENLETATTESQVETVSDPLNKQTEAEKQIDGQTYEEKTVSRTINLYKDGELVDTKVQTVKFHKILGVWYVKNDGAVGITTAQFDAYDIPEQAGYTAQINGVAVDKVDNMSVTADTPNQVVDVYYVANTKTYTEEKVITRAINIWHDDQLVDTIYQEVIFKREVTEDLSTGDKTYGAWDEPTKMFEDFEIPQYEGYKHTEGTVQDRLIVEPESKNIVNDIKYTSEVETVTEYDTVKRVISIYHDGKKVDEMTQVVEFSREGKKNLATGEIKWGEWVAKDGKDIWDAFDAPTYENYTTDTVKIDNKTVKPGMADEEAAIYYTAKVDTRIEERFVRRTILLHMPNGETKKVTQDVTFKREVKKNLATGEETFGAWGMEKITFPEYEVPKVENYIPTMDKVEAAVVDPDTKSWTVDVYYDAAMDVQIEYSTVKRVIGIYLDGKRVDEVTQSVTFKREVKTNLATGEITYGEWDHPEDIWEAYDAPVYENYTTDTVKIDNKTVKPEMADEEAAIYYTSKVDTRIEYSTVKRVIGIYLDGKRVDEVTQSVTFKREVKTNLATGEITYGEWDRPEDIWEAYDAPAYENYTTDTIKIDNKTVKPGIADEEAAIYYTSKVDTRIEYNTVKRVIGIYLDGKRVDEVTQSVTFKREVKTNLATGEITYGEWDRPEDIWEAYDAPAYENYTTGTVKIDNKTVKPGMADEEAAIYYTSKVDTRIEYNTVKRVIGIYLDGKRVDEVTQSVTFKREVKTNLATGEITYGEWDRPEDIWEAYDAPAYENYTTDTVKIDNKTVKPGMADEEAAIYYTSKVDTRIEERVVNRTLVWNMPDGTTRERVQSVTFKREVKKNLATGEETYGEWDLTSGRLMAEKSPEIEGYVPSIKEVEEIIVDPDSQSTKVVIDYYKIGQETKEVKRTFTVRVVDGVLPRSLSAGGDGSQHVQVVTFVRTVYLNAAGEVAAYGDWEKAKAEFEGFDIPQLEGYTTRRTAIEAQMVTPDMTDMEDEILYVAYATQEDTKEVIRKITITDPDGKTHVVEQKALFTRQILIDQFTGQKTLGDWSVEKSTLDGLELPEVEGYKPSQQVEDLVVTPDSEDIEMTITYEKVTPDTPEVPDNGEETPDTPEVPDNGEETPDTPEVPDNGEETPDTPEVPGNGEEMPDAPETPGDGEETPDTPEVPDNEDTEEMPGGSEDDEKEDPSDLVNSNEFETVYLSSKKNMPTSSLNNNGASNNITSEKLNKNSSKMLNATSELPALGEKSIDPKSLGALFAAIACAPLFLITKSKRRYGK